LGKAGDDSGAARGDLAASADDEGKAGGALYKTARVSYKAEAVYPGEKIFFATFSAISRIRWYEEHHQQRVLPAVRADKTADGPPENRAGVDEFFLLGGEIIRPRHGGE
jgi:hypothetical protein